MHSFHRTLNEQPDCWKQGKAKDSGWGSDDEAAALPEANAEEEAIPAPKQTARKQVASAFDLLQGSDDEAKQSPSATIDDSDAELNGAVSPHDSGSDSEDSSFEQQVSCYLFAYIL